MTGELILIHAPAFFDFRERGDVPCFDAVSHRTYALGCQFCGAGVNDIPAIPDPVSHVMWSSS